MNKTHLSTLAALTLLFLSNLSPQLTASAQVATPTPVVASPPGAADKIPATQKSLDQVIRDQQVDPSTLVIFVDLYPDRPYADLHRINGNVGLDADFRKKIKTRVAQEQNNPVQMDVTTTRPLLFIVRPPTDNPVPEDVKFKQGPQGNDLTSVSDGSYRVYYDQTPRPESLTYSIATVTPARQFVITFKKPSQFDFTTAFGALYVVRAKSAPAFGVSKPLFALGRSESLTLDAVTLFGTDSSKDATLGGAVTYGFLLGSKDIEGYKGIFGFPVKLTLTLGGEGLDLSRVGHTKGLFFGAGFSIPTSSR